MDEAEGIEPKHERHVEVADRLLRALRNDDKGRRQFSQTYTDLSNAGEAVRRRLPHQQIDFFLLFDGEFKFGLNG